MTTYPDPKPMTKEQCRTNMIWLNSLHNEEFSQTKDRLKDDNGHCCLGVGVELFDGFDEESVNHNGEAQQMPNLKWWTRIFGWESYRHFAGWPLFAYNDSLKKSFPQIAEIVFTSKIGNEIKKHFDWKPGDEIPEEPAPTTPSPEQTDK